MMQIRRNTMKSLLEEIYVTDSGLRENIKYSEEYSRLEQEANGYYDKLFGILGKEPSRWLDEIWMLEGGMRSEYGLMNFREGIRFVLRLIAEMMETGKE